MLMHSVRSLKFILFKEGELSLARAAKLADLPPASFIAHISRLGLSVINQTEEYVIQD